VPEPLALAVLIQSAWEPVGVADFELAGAELDVKDARALLFVRARAEFQEAEHLLQWSTKTASFELLVREHQPREFTDMRAKGFALRRAR
jgi:hypothetical protein